MDKTIQKIANTQAFGFDDRLGRLVKGYEEKAESEDELSMDSLDMVYAARKEDGDFAAFLKMARERDNASR